MTWTLDVSTDFLDVVDFLEAVTLVPRSGSNTAIAHALRRAVSLREAAASSGKYTQADVTWHLHYSELATPPLLGDRILDGSGGYWTILEVGRETRNTRWRCVSRDLAIVAGLNTQVAIERATRRKGPHGAPVAEWETSAFVRARIQPETLDPILENDQRILRTTHTITLAEPIEFKEGMRVRDANGKLYSIQSYEQPQRVDVLPVLRVVETPWPLAD